MTVRLLTAWSVYPANAIVTLDSGTETGLVADKIASSDTTGGVVYVAPTTPGYDTFARVRVASDGSIQGIVAPDGSVDELGGGLNTVTESNGNVLVDANNLQCTPTEFILKAKQDDVDYDGSFFAAQGYQGTASVVAIATEGPAEDNFASAIFRATARLSDNTQQGLFEVQARLTYSEIKSNYKGSGVIWDSTIRSDNDSTSYKASIPATGQSVEIGVTSTGAFLTIGNGGLIVSGVPTSDPAVAGALWNNGGVLSISAG